VLTVVEASIKRRVKDLRDEAGARRRMLWFTVASPGGVFES
jgi:hypothetical protein